MSDEYRCVHCGSTDGFKRRRYDFKWECVNLTKCTARQRQNEADTDLA